MWKLVLVLLIVTTADQRVIVQQPLDGRQFASQAQCEAFTKGWKGQVKPPELQRIAETRAPAHRGQMKSVSLIDAGCADPAWSGAFPVLKPEEGFPPATPRQKPAH
ncbi:MAG: hypothetical protein L6R19_26535 [Alphaproteobacteria bacterium]|nr:hypothetical protein [Alphaproteobacteria bacterium]